MEKLKKYGKWIIKGLALIGGTVAMYTNPIAGSVAGIIAVSSSISSSVKDKSVNPILTLFMKCINLFAVNIDKAENDKKVNDTVKKK